MSLQVIQVKPGDAGAKLSLNLKKAEPFKIALSWDEGKDLDLHALFCVNRGDGLGAKASVMEDILSSYNVKRTIQGEITGTLSKNPDGTFSTHNGSMLHSKDADNGQSDGEDEWVKIYPDKLPAVDANSVIEIPLISMIHPQSGGASFSLVKNPKIVVYDMSGAPLLQINLSQDFGQYCGVHIGSIVIVDQTPSFQSVGNGFVTDFNSVLANYS
jgi:tellurium resistance protein TerD